MPQLAASMHDIGIVIVLVICALIMVFPFIMIGSLLARDVRAERAAHRADTLVEPDSPQ